MQDQSEVRIPAMRERLVHYLNKLSDHELQRRVWSQSAQKPSTYYDSLEFPMTFLYEDTDLDEGADFWIGDMLKNEAEARAVDDVIAAIDKVYEKYPTEMRDNEWIELDEWQDVVKAAKRAYELIAEPEPEPTVFGQAQETE